MVAETSSGARGALWVVARRTARRACRSGAGWGAVFGLVVAARLAEFTSQFPTAAARADLARNLTSNAGIAILFGQPRRVDTAGGYAALTLGVVTLIGSVWGLLMTIRLTRGEEEAGHWELYLTGPTTRRGAAVGAAAGVGIGLAALWVAAAAVTAAVGARSDPGLSVSSSAFYALAVVAAPGMFASIGLLAAQLAPTRRGANALGAGILGAAFLVRAVADSDTQLKALRWASPFGWVHELRPFTGSHPVALAPIVVLIGGIVAAAVLLAGRRDLGAGVLPSRDTAPPRTGLLSGHLGLTARLTMPVAAGWIAGLAIFGFVFGLISVAVGETFGRSEGFQEMIGRLGGQRSGTESYLGMAFLVGAALLAFAAAGQIAATRAEEAESHLDHLVARAVGRSQWLAGRLGAAAGLVLAAGTIAGLSAFAGTATNNGGPGLARLLAAGANIVPPALFVVGAGALSLALWPRRATAVTYALVAWSVLVQFLGATTGNNRWLNNTSILGHSTPAPSADPNWTANITLIILGLVTALAGAVLFARRDLAGD